jgi:hypothetical protein
MIAELTLYDAFSLKLKHLTQRERFPTTMYQIIVLSLRISPPSI